MNNFVSRKASSAALLCLCVAVFYSNAFAQSVDTKQPIIRSLPTEFQNQQGYFGYSMVLHQVDAGPADFQTTVESSRIIVSAPNGTTLGGAVPNTGLIFVCPVQPGNCEGLMGDGQEVDNRLFDAEDNADNEVKQGQFLGSSMYSSGDTFLTCAHRYMIVEGNTPYPVGRCFFSGRNLQGFTEYSPCRDANTNLQFLCLAGSGSAVAETSTNGETAIGVGLPGAGANFTSPSRFFYSFKGGVYRRNPAGVSAFLEGTGGFALQGYTMTSGHILSLEREDFVVSSPRRISFISAEQARTNISLQRFAGAVEVVMNTDDAFQVVTENDLRGEQHGEYYGFSVVALDLNGDGYDELIVGAPLYRDGLNGAEAGRVFVYSNAEGSLAFLTHLNGDREPYSRFGYAMANLGDISGDGLEDVAISAPYGSGPGKVFIYTGSASTLITITPAQVISGDDLRISPPLTNLTAFGTSLASGVDVDGNTYNDLAIGSTGSQSVFLLRTYPVALVSTSITSQPSIVDLDLFDCVSTETGGNHSCFVIEACATYSGRGLNRSLELTYNLTLERNNQQLGLQQRLFFDIPGQPNTIEVLRVAAAEQETCTPFTVYVVDGVADRLNAFTVEFEVSPQPLPVSSSTGNDNLVDFSTFPIVSSTGTRLLQVETLKDCNGSVCYPDLNLQHTGTTFLSSQAGEIPTNLIAGLISNVSLGLDISNQGDDAFQAILSFSLPSTLLEFVRVEPRSAFITCSSQPTNDMNTSHVCNIGNPFGPDQQVAIALVLRPTARLTGEEPPINLNFTLSSANPEEIADDLANNMVSVTLETSARAGLSIDPGTVNPQQLSFAPIAPEGEIQSVQDLGPDFTTTFVVRNAGPSLIPNTQIVVYWPLNSTSNESLYYLYPTIISGQSTGGRIVCNMTYSNPDRLPLGTTGQSGNTTSEADVGRQKRRSRRRIPSHLRRTRQAQAEEQSVTTTVDVQAQDITLSCEGGGGGSDVVCVPIVCSIFQLQQGGNARLDITAHLDDRFFAMSQVDRFTIVTAASVSIVGSDYIEQVGRPTMSTAQVRVIPAMLPPPPSGGPGQTVEPWIIVVSIIAAVIVIAVVAGLLWGFGFFSRKKHQEIKRKREALEELTGSTENILEAEVVPASNTTGGE